jgi:hypothetical protein
VRVRGLARKREKFEGNGDVGTDTERKALCPMSSLQLRRVGQIAASLVLLPIGREIRANAAEARNQSDAQTGEDAEKEEAQSDDN